MTTPHLYRIITATAWQEAQRLGVVPRCGNDRRMNRIHLNVREAVESVASRYFTAEERPLVLDVDTRGFRERLEWQAPCAAFPWPRALADLPALPLAAVVATHRLEPADVDGPTAYRWR